MPPTQCSRFAGPHAGEQAERASPTRTLALRAAKGPAIENVFVIGSAEIFREALAHSDLRWVYLTRVAGRFGCEVAIPDLDALGFVTSAWEGEQAGEDSGVTYTIERLTRVPEPRDGS